MMFGPPAAMAAMGTSVARLHEYQGKALLKEHGIAVPKGSVASSPAEAERIARELGGPVVLKIQAWTTGRAAIGGVKFADTPEEAAIATKELLDITVGNFPVEQVLVEEKIAIKHELFVSLTVDDAARAPMILLALEGGTGIEDRAGDVAKLPVHVRDGVDRDSLDHAIGNSSLPKAQHAPLAEAVASIATVAKSVEARSVEINPLVVTDDGRVMAADCRMTVDDYAVFRHPELGIDIARELDHPPTALERIAYHVEEADHRGTFYFAQLNTKPDAGSKGLVGFHGAGGGGSMMSMDAITNVGFTIANFTDTSGNPSAAKVYRAARIILSQPDLCGYFGSGSGVASQEQFWSAYGLAKAFWELELSIPAVIRLGGNSEDRAIDILQDACTDLPAAIEGYRKDDTPGVIGQRFASLVIAASATWQPRSPRKPSFVGTSGATSFAITGGTVWIDTPRWNDALPTVQEFAPGLFDADTSAPTLAIDAEAFAGKDSELIACEVECRRRGCDAVFVELDIPGLTEVAGGAH